MILRTNNESRDLGPGNGTAGVRDEDGHRTTTITGTLVTAPPATGKNDPLTPSQMRQDDRPVTNGRPRKPLDDEQMAARRASWRASKRRARERQERAA